MESSAANIPTPVTRPTNLRAYLAGTGATAALIGGAVVVFLAVAAFVGFNGLPFGADDSSDATVELTGTAPEAAAAAAGPAAAAVAATPATPGPRATAEIHAALPPGTIPPGGGDGGINGAGPGTVPIDPNTSLPPGTPAPAGLPGALDNAANGLDSTTGNLGLDLGLGGVTDGVTGPADQTLNDTLDGVGGALGTPNLGNQATNGLNGVTNSVIGERSAVDGLLNP